MLRYRASSRSKGEVSWFVSSCSGHLAYDLELRCGSTFKGRVCSATWGSLSIYEGHVRNSSRFGRAIRKLLDVRQKARGPLLVATVILGFLSIFKNNQAPSPFEALNSVCLSRCQNDVRPPVQRMCGPRAFSRVSTGDSHIPSSCEMKDEPAFQPLLANRAFFWVRASRCRFHLRQLNQGPLTYLLLKEASSWGALANFSYHFSWARESALIWRWYGVHGAFLVLLCWNWCSSKLETVVSGNLWSWLNEVMPLVLYNVEYTMVLEPMQGNRASSWVDLALENDDISVIH